MKTCKKVILCADDYGQKVSISQAIVRLVAEKRLSAVSCMVTKADWPAHWATLLPYQDQVDVGLHFNLTEGAPLSVAMNRGKDFMPLGRLLTRALLGRLDQNAIAAELRAQLLAFRSVTGRWPDFIDGHQHVQHFPRVRDALLSVYETELSGTGCYIRCVDDPSVWRLLSGLARFKRIVLQCSGAARLKRRLLARRIPHNSSFSGVYPFSKGLDYEKFFPLFLSRVSEGGLILCHPGFGESDPYDPITAARGSEFRYLMGPHFLAACEHACVKLSRFYS